MRLSLCVSMLIVLLGCGKSPEGTTEIIEDSTQVGVLPVETATLSENETKWAQHLDRFMQDSDVIKDGYPSVVYSRSNEIVSYQVRYFFEDDVLIWVHIALSEEGGIAENYFVARDPEGTFYLHYGTEVKGAFGYVGMEGGEWYEVRTDGNYKPILVGPGDPDKFEYEIEFDEHMKIVRANLDKFKFKDGVYEYSIPSAGAAGDETYEIPELLYTSNLLSSTRFNPEMIAGYLDTYYPLYEDASGTFYRHMVCTGGEDFITLRLEAGNYRWEEEVSGETTVYAIKGWEESEGDAFYATLEHNGNRLNKIIVYAENDGLLMVDGRVYTAEPKKFDFIYLKCD
jgi:hypothetical protein